MADIKEILGAVKLPEKTHPLCLRTDLVADWEALERQLKQAQKRDAGSDSLAGSGGGARQIAEQMARLEDEMAEHTVTFRLRALGSKSWADLIAQYPPTDEQKKLGGDTDWEAAAPALLAACAVDPAMDEEQAAELSDKVTEATWNRLSMVVLELNRRDVNVPFSSLASAARSGSASK